ncbi:UNKNOWN [Stylonychia lemnae]|uniref:Uncharacterized protein n=1 Tax=Stylonychia lemnae TaxID=5949 RepID=A0A078A5A3_STYLE|nr:UNKNOWN [Stylonychia lemnae]|eukprot:CDW77064.1 UNKNOWN [Stylonychia lemnae]
MLTRNTFKFSVFIFKIISDLFHVMPESLESPARSRAVSPLQADNKRQSLSTFNDQKNQASFRARPSSANTKKINNNHTKKYTVKEVTAFQGWNNVPPQKPQLAQQQQKNEGQTRISQLLRDQFSPINRHANPYFKDSKPQSRPLTALGGHEKQKNNQVFDSSSYSNHQNQLSIQPMLQRMVEQIKIVKDFAKSQKGQEYISNMHKKTSMKDQAPQNGPKFVQVSKTDKSNIQKKKISGPFPNKQALDFRIQKPKKLLNDQQRYIYPSKINLGLNVFDESDVSEENINQQYYHEQNQINPSSKNLSNNPGENLKGNNKQNISPLVTKLKGNRSFTNIYEDEYEKDNLNTTHNYNRSSSSLNMLQRSQTFQQTEESKKNRVIIQSKIQTSTGETKILNFQYIKTDTFNNTRSNQDQLDTPNLSKAGSFVIRQDEDKKIRQSSIKDVQSPAQECNTQKDQEKLKVQYKDKLLIKYKRPFTPEKWAISNAIMINFSEQNLHQLQKTNQISNANRDRKVYKIQRNEKTNQHNREQIKQIISKDKSQNLFDKPEFIINGKTNHQTTIISNNQNQIPTSNMEQKTRNMKDLNLKAVKQVKSKNRMVYSSRIQQGSQQSGIKRRKKSKNKNAIAVTINIERLENAQQNDQSKYQPL